MGNEPEGILLITGTVGTGKTTIATEIGAQLAAMNLHNAVVDLDWLGWVNVGNDFNGYDQLIIQNLVSAWQNYRTIGVEYLVLARAFLQREPVDILLNTFPNTPMIIVRLTASKETIKKRLSQRDSAETLREHLAEMEVMNQIMDGLNLENAIVNNDSLSEKETASQIIHITNWRGKGSK